MKIMKIAALTLAFAALPAVAGKALLDENYRRLADAPQLDYSAPGIEAGLDSLQLERKRARGMQSQLSMPFYSFAPLLPRRES